MSKIKRIPKKVIFIIIVAILLVIALAFIKYRLEPTQVMEIPNTVDYYYYKDLDSGLNYVSVTRFCIVTKPPKTKSELRDLMIDYYKSNKSEIEKLEDKTKSDCEIYTIYFYREAWDFTRYWRPDLRWVEYDSEDVWNQLRDHRSESLGFITFNPISEEGSDGCVRLNGESEDYYFPNSLLE